MSGASDNRDHSGACGFCGTSVRQGFNTCPSCGANFRRESTAGEVFGFMLKFTIGFGIIYSIVFILGMVALSRALGHSDAGPAPDWAPMAALAGAFVYMAIWVYVLRLGMAATKRFGWFRLQD